MLKKLKEKGNETVTICNGLKLKVKYWKCCMTDVVDIEEMYIIIYFLFYLSNGLNSSKVYTILQW